MLKTSLINIQKRNAFSGTVIPWNVVFLGKLIVAQLLKKFHAFLMKSETLFCSSNNSPQSQLNPVYTLTPYLFKFLSAYFPCLEKVRVGL
jgi:hypothetical protein